MSYYESGSTSTVDVYVDLPIPSAWSMFASAFMSDTSVRDSMIKTVYNHMNSNTSGQIFPERYNTTDNSARNGFAG